MSVSTDTNDLNGLVGTSIY